MKVILCFSTRHLQKRLSRLDFGRQPCDPKKADGAMIQAVESGNPPLWLMLDADAYGLWDKKLAEMAAEFDCLRGTGVNTAFEDVTAALVGG